MWRSLAAEPTLTSQILEQLLEKVNRDVPYKESKCFLLGSGSERIATPLPLAVSVLLQPLSRPQPLGDAGPNTWMLFSFPWLGGVVPGVDSGNNASLCNAY